MVAHVPAAASGLVEEIRQNRCTRDLQIYCGFPAMVPQTELLSKNERYLKPSSLAKMKCLLKNHVSRDQALRDSVAVSIVMNPRDIGQDALLGHFDFRA